MMNLERKNQCLQLKTRFYNHLLRYNSFRSQGI
nr:MAG TPA: WD repeat-containing protein [Caudoviricetes sp.]